MKFWLLQKAGTVFLTTTTGLCVLSPGAATCQERTEGGDKIQQRLMELFAREGRMAPPKSPSPSAKTPAKSQTRRQPGIQAPVTGALPPVKSVPIQNAVATPESVAQDPAPPVPAITPRLAAASKPETQRPTATDTDNPFASFPEITPQVKSQPVPGPPEIAPPAKSDPFADFPVMAPQVTPHPIAGPTEAAPQVTPHPIAGPAEVAPQEKTHPLADVADVPESAFELPWMTEPAPQATSAKAATVLTPAMHETPESTIPEPDIFAPVQYVTDKAEEQESTIAKPEQTATVETQAAPAVPTTEKTPAAPSDKPFAAVQPPSVPEVELLDAPAAPKQTVAAKVDEPKPALKVPVVVKTPKLGLDGYCPVTLREQRQLIKGNPVLTSSWHGTEYQFASVASRNQFDQNPEVYAPAEAGQDVILMKSEAQTASGSLKHAVWYQRQLYLFQSADNLATFSSDPQKYAQHQ